MPRSPLHKIKLVLEIRLHVRRKSIRVHCPITSILISRYLCCLDHYRYAEINLKICFYSNLVLLSAFLMLQRSLTSTYQMIRIQLKSFLQYEFTVFFSKPPSSQVKIRNISFTVHHEAQEFVSLFHSRFIVSL